MNNQVSHRYRKDLFPTHLYQISLRQQNQVLKSLLLPKIEQYHNDLKISPPNGWITNHVYTSYNQESINRKLLLESKEVCDHYSQHFRKIFGPQIGFQFHDAWFNYYVDGEYQEQHDHINAQFNDPDSHFSAIHFLNFDKTRHVPVTFVDPVSKLNRRYRSDYTYSPELEEGDLIVFPSHLDHFVRPSQPTPDYPRITIAFNLRVMTHGN